MRESPVIGVSPWHCWPAHGSDPTKSFLQWGQGHGRGLQGGVPHSSGVRLQSWFCPHLSSSAKLRECFEREAKTISQLSRPFATLSSH